MPCQMRGTKPYGNFHTLVLEIWLTNDTSRLYVVVFVEIIYAAKKMHLTGQEDVFGTAGQVGFVLLYQLGN